MVGVFGLTLGISIVGLSVLLGVKHFEIQTGKRFLGRLRPALSRMLHAVVAFAQYVLPAMLRHMAYRALQATYSWVGHLVARGIVFVERFLERTLHTVRQKSQPTRTGGQASTFLREVAAHKRRLLSREKSERVIFDE